MTERRTRSGSGVWPASKPTMNLSRDTFFTLRDDLRYQLQDRPWIKWAAGAAGLLAVTAVVLWIARPAASDGLLSGEKLAQHFTVRFEDTGDAMEVPLGFISRELINRQGTASEDWKLTNPKTSQMTGVLTDRGAWSRIVKQVNEHKAQANVPAQP